MFRDDEFRVQGNDDDISPFVGKRIRKNHPKARAYDRTVVLKAEPNGSGA